MCASRIARHAVLFVVLLLTTSACDGLSDINEDPNNPLDVAERLQLPALESNFSYEIIANAAVRIPAHWIQHLAWSGAPPSADLYDVDESDVNNLWEFFAFTDVLNNARGLAMQAETNGNFAYAGIAKIHEAWTYSILTDLWGDVPLSEAFDPDNLSPAYDTQEEVYQHVFALLDEAVADLQMDSPQTPGPSADLLYGGDLEAWTRLAYTLKARFSMRLSKAPGYDASKQAMEALEALEQGFQSNADDAEFTYFDQAGAENPWYQWVIDGKWDTRDQLSVYYVNLLESLDDPRLPIHARPVGAVDTDGLVEDFDPDSIYYEGQPSGGEGLGADDVSSIGEFFSAPDAPLTWISYASSQFVKAEATLTTQGAAAAQPIYEHAIRADMEKLGVDAVEIDDYIASLPPLTAAGVDPEQEILTQKYIANFINVEAYNDWRRTGYPELQPVDAPERRIDIIPLRFPPPASELARNEANIPSYVRGMGFDAMRVPVWWDTTVPPGALPNQ